MSCQPVTVGLRRLSSGMTLKPNFYFILYIVFSIGISPARQNTEFTAGGKPSTLPAILLIVRKTILPLLFTIQTVYCWTSFYKAQFLQYDDNYGLLIHSFIIALATMIFLIILWFSKRQLMRDNKVAIIIWTIFGSPVTFIVAALFYNTIFRTTLAT